MTETMDQGAVHIMFTAFSKFITKILQSFYFLIM